MMRILLLDTTHHPLSDSDMADPTVAPEYEAADVVIHIFAPFKAQVVKGDAEVVDVRAGIPRGYRLITREG